MYKLLLAVGLSVGLLSSTTTLKWKLRKPQCQVILHLKTSLGLIKYSFLGSIWLVVISLSLDAFSPKAPQTNANLKASSRFYPDKVSKDLPEPLWVPATVLNHLHQSCLSPLCSWKSPCCNVSLLPLILLVRVPHSPTGLVLSWSFARQIHSSGSSSESCFPASCYRHHRWTKLILWAPIVNLWGCIT